MDEHWKVDSLMFTGHALRQMFDRAISTDQVRAVAECGIAIADYPGDTPFPSRLMFGMAVERPLHVVLAYDKRSQTGYIVTTYEPTLENWESDFKKRR